MENQSTRGRIAHFQYECPGLHGPGTRQRIEPRAMHSLFEESAIEIPFFQRRYCWDKTVCRKYFKDTTERTGHMLGRTIFVRRTGPDRIICLDGQQRITTTMLLLKALSLHLSSSAHPDAARTRQRIAAVVWRAPEQARLVPSLADRQPYEACLAGHLDGDSCQAEALHLFVSLFRRCPHPPALLFERILSTCIMYVEPLNEVHVGQIFTWHQERSLCGFGAILQNDRPGHHLAALDLTRNLLLSHVLHLPTAACEAFYRQRWLEPIEQRLPPPPDAFLEAYLRHRAPARVPPCAFEQSVRQVQESKFGALVNKTAIHALLLYARFVSLYETSPDNEVWLAKLAEYALEYGEK